MKRTRQQWAAVCPRTVAETASPAAVMYLLRDALADIEALHAQATQDQPERSGPVEALRSAIAVGRRAIGDHSAPHDCYATGPMTGDPFRDLVECPACAALAEYDRIDAAMAGKGGRP